MQDLMEATGLEKGGLYRHFETKESLAVEAFRYSLQRVIEVRTEGIGEPLDALDRLRLVIQNFVQVPSPIPGGCPLMNMAADADAGSPKLLALAKEGLNVWRKKLYKVVEEGITHGEIRATVSPRQIATVLISTLEGALMVSRLEKSKEALIEAQGFLEAFLLTLRAKPHAAKRLGIEQVK